MPAERRPAFPPIPRVSGPLAVKVIYPSAKALLSVRDSNFLLGSVGNGDATLTINGNPVRVEPNGAFVAWLPVPPRETPRYDLVAIVGTDTQRLAHPIRYTASSGPLPLEGALLIDPKTVLPASRLAFRDDEAIRVAVVAPANASVVWRSPVGVRLLAANGDSWSVSLPARLLRAETELVVTRGADSVRLPLARVIDPDSLPIVSLGDSVMPVVPDSDRVIHGRLSPGETYKWFLLPRTRLRATGQVPGYTRVRLDQALEVWIASSDAVPLPDDPMTLTRAVATSGRVRASPFGADVVIPLSRPPAYQVEERGSDIILTLYNTEGIGDRTRYPGTEQFVRTVEWTQEASDRVVYTIRLARPAFGYHVIWDRNALVLRVRRPPAIANAARPLNGLRIVVDPGHPPAGATGPTGLYEGDAVLEVGRILHDLLVERGANVLMTRTTRDTVPLGARPIMARRANADALVSIHLNALPDGANPLIAQGTETYFFHPHAEALARAIHVGMLRTMGLPDRGTFTRDLALARQPWMPSILAEGAYIILPDAEAALRTREFQGQYALGLLEGLETYFRSLAP